MDLAYKYTNKINYQLLVRVFKKMKIAPIGRRERSELSAAKPAHAGCPAVEGASVGRKGRLRSRDCELFAEREQKAAWTAAASVPCPPFLFL